MQPRIRRDGQRQVEQRQRLARPAQPGQALAKGIPVGDPWDPTTMAGPVVNSAAMERILGMIERAKADGARLVTGGSRIGGDLAEEVENTTSKLTDADRKAIVAYLHSVPAVAHEVKKKEAAK